MWSIRSALKLDSSAPNGKLLELERSEGRFRQVEQEDPERFRALVASAEADIQARWAMYENLARALTPEQAPAPR